MILPKELALLQFQIASTVLSCNPFRIVNFFVIMQWHTKSQLTTWKRLTAIFQ